MVVAEDIYVNYWKAVAAAAAVLLALAAAYLALNPRGSTGEWPRIRVATLQGGISTLDLVEGLGLGERHGVRVEVVRLQRTPDIATAIVKGEVDAAIVPAEVAARMLEEGAKIRIVGVDMLQNQAIVSSKPGIKAPEDLRGRRVAAVTASGTYKMFKAYMAIIYGLRVETRGRGGDIEVLNVPPGSLVDALERGDVDAIVAWEPIVSMALARGAHVVADYRDLWERAGVEGMPVMLVWIARSDADAAALRKLLEAREEAAEIWVSNPDVTGRIIGELYGLAPHVFDTMYERIIIYKGPLNNTAIEGIRSEWWLAWKGGYLPRDPASIPEDVFAAP